MAVVGAVVLFTDLVGSTEQSSRLSVAESESLRHTHFELLRAALAAHDGTEVKNLGDGLMVVFSVPSAALACAVAMQQAIDRHNRSAPEPLAVRIGISGGEATLEDGDYFGDPVVEASRLCAHAVGGQVLVSEVVRSMAGRRSPHTFMPVGALELKGLPDATPHRRAGLGAGGRAGRWRAATDPAAGGAGSGLLRPGHRTGRPGRRPQDDRRRGRPAGAAAAGRTRDGEDDPLRRVRPRRPCRRRRRAVRTLRGRAGDSLSALRRGTRPLRLPRHDR